MLNGLIKFIRGLAPSREPDEVALHSHCPPPAIVRGSLTDRGGYRLDFECSGISADAPESCDLACPVCGAADALKNDPLIGCDRPWPCPYDRPLACCVCWSLVLLVRPAGSPTKLVVSDLAVDTLRAWFPHRWQALSNLQRHYRRQQLKVIRGDFDGGWTPAGEGNAGAARSREDL